MLLDVTNHDMNKVITNSETVREFYQLFSDIDILSHTFYNRDAYLASKTKQLITDAKHISKTANDPELSKTLDIFLINLRLFLSQCSDINTILKKRTEIDLKTHHELDKLENRISTLLLNYALNKEEPEYAEQLLSLAIGYRESLLLIGKLFAEYDFHNVPLVNTKLSQVVKEIEDLNLRLQTITASTPEVSQLGRNIIQKIQEYKIIIIRVEEAAQQFSMQIDTLSETKKLILMILKNIEATVFNAVSEVTTTIENIFITSVILVLVLCLLVILILAITTTYMIRTSIYKPMSSILEGITTFGQGNLSVRLDLNRKDEWNTIETAFNKMADELLASNKSKSEFLANMSHELRTPLHQILSFSQLGIKKIDAINKEKFLQYLSMIRVSGKHLLILLNDLLDLSKFESGKMKYEMIHNDLKLIVANLSIEFDGLLKEKNITLEISENNALTEIVCDRNRIGQIIRNLFSNAIKFTPAGKKINVSMALDKPINKQNQSNDKTESFLLFKISDQGVGIPENELDSIFDKFIQSSKTKTGAGGTGLGLAICREIISAHNGKIWAENNPEGGSTFSFLLPYQQMKKKQNQMSVDIS